MQRIEIHQHAPDHAGQLQRKLDQGAALHAEGPLSRSGRKTLTPTKPGLKLLAIMMRFAPGCPLNSNIKANSSGSNVTVRLLREGQLWGLACVNFLLCTLEAQECCMPRHFGRRMLSPSPAAMQPAALGEPVQDHEQCVGRLLLGWPDFRPSELGVHLGGSQLHCCGDGRVRLANYAAAALGGHRRAAASSAYSCLLTIHKQI